MKTYIKISHDTLKIEEEEKEYVILSVEQGPHNFKPWISMARDDSKGNRKWLDGKWLHLGKCAISIIAHPRIVS